mgnify:CR=1 FL=1
MNNDNDNGKWLQPFHNSNKYKRLPLYGVRSSNMTIAEQGLWLMPWA